MSKTLLYYCPYAIGGVLDYAWHQAHALADLSITVTFLTAGSRSPLRGMVTANVEVQDEVQHLNGPKILRRIRRASLVRENVTHLCEYIKQHDCRHVLMSSYSEYGAPLWSGPLKTLSLSGVRFGAILHDPVRNYVVGPQWFHEWSIRCGYSFLSEAFVHEELDRAQAGIPEHVQMSVIPHGPYTFPDPVE